MYETYCLSKITAALIKMFGLGRNNTLLNWGYTVTSLLVTHYIFSLVIKLLTPAAGQTE